MKAKTNIPGIAFALFFLSTASFLTNCGTMANGRGWGQDATLSPGWGRIGTAALNAVRAPETWAPAAGALAFQIGHADRNVSDWAWKRTPVYGSQQNAQQMSDNLLKASGIIWGASVAATPSGDSFGEWTINKIKGFGVQEGTGVLMRATIGFLKDATDRQRPNGGGRSSFPSAHATESALYLTQTSKNLEAFDLGEGVLIASRIGLGAVSVATAWARVEAGQHYPSDVLAGIAIGHFFGAFFTDAFIGLDNPRNVMVLLEPSRQGLLASVRFSY